MLNFQDEINLFARNVEWMVATSSNQNTTKLLYVENLLIFFNENNRRKFNSTMRELELKTRCFMNPNEDFVYNYGFNTIIV